MPTLTFAFAPSPESNDHEVRVLLDGRDILRDRDHSALGLDPVEFFAQAALRGGGTLLIGRCSCGCIGCGDVSVEVFDNVTSIEWRSDHSRIGRTVFPRNEYMAAFEAGAMDHSWETPGRTVERLVAELDFSDFRRQGLLFRWASTRCENNQIALSFDKSGRQELMRVPWNGQSPASAIVAVREFIESWLPSP